MDPDPAIEDTAKPATEDTAEPATEDTAKPATEDTADPATEDTADVATALPPVAARVAAFVSILLGGLGGGIVGYYFAALQCDGSCDLINGSSMLVGTIIGAVGTALVAAMTLRAAGEWDTGMPWSKDA